MTTDIAGVAQAISGHRFTEAYPHLAPDIRWVLVGSAVIAGRDAVIAACDDTAAQLAGVSTEFSRFLVVADGDTVVIDAVGRYVDAAGAISVVSSCDIYEFDREELTTITSYTVELPAG